MGLRSTALVGLLAALTACGSGTGRPDAADPPLPVFTAPPSTWTGTPAAVRTSTVETSGTRPAGSDPSVSGTSGKLPQIPSSTLPALHGFTYVDLEPSGDPVRPPKVTGQPRIHGLAVVGVAKGNNPDTLPTATIELVRMDSSLASDPALDVLATKMATALVHGRPTTSRTVGGVKVLMASNVEGLGIHSAVFRYQADVVMVFSPDKGTNRKIVAAYLAASRPAGAP